MLRLLEFDAEIEHHGKVNAVIVVEQVGIRKMLPGQRETDLRIVLLNFGIKMMPRTVIVISVAFFIV